LSEPFDGNAPTLAQATLIGSTVMAEQSSLAPSAFSQSLSVSQYKIDSSNDSFLMKKGKSLLLMTRANFFYKLADREINLGVCLQRPGKCGMHDGFLLHDGITDGQALATSIGQHHTIDKADLSKTLKAIVSVHNSDTSSNQGFLSYFSTTFNQGVAPGEYFWPTFPEGPAVCPRQSPQLFADFLDQETFSSSLVPIPGSVVRMLRMDLITLENPAMGVKAGQHVDLLVLDIRGLGMPTFLTGESQVNKWKDALGEVARNISLSTELQTIVTNFAS
jgi:hypothetical protein